jgi:hypothetical protein
MKLTIYLAAFIATLVSAHAVPAVGLGKTHYTILTNQADFAAANVEGRAAELNTDNTDTPPGGSCGVAFAHTELSGQTKWLRHTDGGLSRFDFQARSAKVEGSCQCTFYEYVLVKVI